MTYKQFVDWCEQRACDGQWDMVTAIVCLDVIRKINSIKYKWFWNKRKEEVEREKEWQRLNTEFGIEGLCK